MAPEEAAAAGASREPAGRLFFALWPDESMREAMVRAVRQPAWAYRGSLRGSRPVPARNLHVTLAFLGSVPERRLPELAGVARRAAECLGPEGGRMDPPCPLELVFDHLEQWRAAHVLCAPPAGPPKAVVALARRLQRLLISHGFAPDLKPFRPHVTVMRKVARSVPVESTSPMDKMGPVVWRFTELALIASRTLPEGALYSVVGSYPLCGGRNSANNNETP